MVWTRTVPGRSGEVLARPVQLLRVLEVFPLLKSSLVTDENLGADLGTIAVRVRSVSQSDAASAIVGSRSLPGGR